MKWVPEEPNLIVETSEDLHLRLFDLRKKPFKPIYEQKLETNFATFCDVQENLMVTAHRGFNNQGAEVKVWDLRKLVDMTVQGESEASEKQPYGYKSVYRGYEFSPECVRFLDTK